MFRTTRRPARRPMVATGAAVLAVAAAATIAAGAPAGATPSATPGVQARTSSHYGFNRPTAIAAAGGHLWIANRAGNSVTETNADGGFVRRISASKFRFASPVAIAVSGRDLFVLNHQGSVTEIASGNGSLVRVIRGSRYHFDGPTALIAHGGNIWVADTASAAVTEFSAGSGALVRVLNPHHANRGGLHHPVALTAAGSHIWVLNDTRDASSPGVGSLSEISAATGAFVGVTSGTRYGFAQSRGVAFDGTHLWVSDSATDSVTELTASGGFVQVVSNSSHNQNYGFDAPTMVAARAGHVYVISPPGASPMITQIEPSTAIGNWYECNTNVPDPNFLNPTGLAVQDHHVWVVSPANNSLAELRTSTGALIHSFT
jgi:hypothetical protein